MNLGLILSLESKNNINLSCKMGTSVIASKNYKNGYKTLDHSINAFLSSNSLNPEKIKSLTTICDITGFNPSTAKNSDSIGYIQQLPGNYSIDIKKINIREKTYRIHSINLGMTKDMDPLKKITDAISYFNNRGIKKIGINSYFSKSYPEIENNTCKVISDISNVKLEIIKSNIFNISDYILREHYLLTNLIYMEQARNLVYKVNTALDYSNIKCPLYFLRGDGFIIDEASILKEPASTWLSDHTGRILGASRVAGVENAIIISRTNNEITASGVSSSLPVLVDDSTRIFETRSPGFFPKIIHINDLGSTDEMRDTVNRFNMTKDSFSPLINLTEYAPEDFSLMNKYMKIDDSSALTAIGAASANYSKNFMTNVFNATSAKIEESKSHLLEEAERYFFENKIDIKNISYDFSVSPLKYMKYSSYFIKLSAKGYIN